MLERRFKEINSNSLYSCIKVAPNQPSAKVQMKLQELKIFYENSALSFDKALEDKNYG